MRAVVEILTKALVDFPEQVEVTERGDHRSVVVEVRVAPSDVGKVIGKQGKIARAIRAVAKAAAVRDDKRVTVEFR